MSDFKPRTEEEAQMAGLLIPGEYRAVVTKCERTESKKGDPMLKLMLEVFDGEGGKAVVWDYVSDAWMPHKLRHLCVAGGAENLYNSGALQPIAAFLVGRDVRVDLGTQPPKDGYEAKNVVRDYMADEDAGEPHGEAVERDKAPEDDDLPF